MSQIKQSQQTRRPVVKSTQLTSRSQRSEKTNGWSQNGEAAQAKVPSMSTRLDAKHTVTGRTPAQSATLQVESTNLLKRSLSKLRIKESISPNKQKSAAQSKRQPLQPLSKIPQPTAPGSCTRILGTDVEQSAFVLHTLAPPRDQPPSSRPIHHLQSNTPRQRDDLDNRNASQPYAPTAIPSLSPIADKNPAEVRMKAMQLGIFKISEADLKERYQFLNEIGAGEWGSVWSVEALRPLDHLPTSAYRSLQVVKLTANGTYTVDNSSNFRPLAVKLCKRETKYSAAARTQRLWNEFKVLRTLMDQLPRAEQVNVNSPNCRVRNDRTGWHPNVVNFYEFLLTPALAMLVMPKFDEPMKVCLGDTLCRNYFQQLLSAVHWLHQHCVCHNDIKVDNLGVTYDTTGLGRDVVTLFDFGFANRYDPLEEGAFMSKDVWGTPEYLAPERCRATLHDERKTDIWALGITFFEMLTGRTPFEHHDEKFDSKEKFEEYYARAERGTWLGDYDMSCEMEDLIRKMLRHDPKERIDAAGGLLHPQFDPHHGMQRDSFDELLQLSYEDDHMRVAQDIIVEPEVSLLQEDADDSDVMIQDLVAQTERLDALHSGTHEHPSLPASPGVSRAVVATHRSLAPGSPSLSQVGMDSRLTDLMCVSPPWRGRPPPRQGTPIPSAQRSHILTQSLVPDGNEEQDGSDTSMSDHSPVAIARASMASLTRPVLVPATKQSPFRLRLGERPHLRPVEEKMASTPLSAPAELTQKPLAPALCPMSLPPVGREKVNAPQPPRAEAVARGNVVASLAKKFDASNFLARPPPHITAQTGGTGLGLTIRGQPVAKLGHGHRRSKSYTLTSTQHGVQRHSVRRSTGSFVPTPEEALPRCARRLFGPEPSAGSNVPQAQPQAEIDGATDIGSARSDTKNAGADLGDTQPSRLTEPAAGRTPALHAVLAGDHPDVSSHKRLRSPAASSSLTSVTPSPVVGEEVIFKKLKKMASLAGLLSKMIDETKSTILSPAPKTPLREGSVSTDATDISPGLLVTPVRSTEEDGGDGGDVSMVSAAYSLDLSGSRHDQPSAGTWPNGETGALGEAPSPAQVETMYSSFLLSQNVARSGSGFLSPTPTPTPTASTGAGTGTGRARPRTLAALFASPAPAPSFEHLKPRTPHSNSRPPTADTEVRPSSSPAKRTQQRSTGKAGKLARLFRKPPS